jgi:hypothetical protein
VRPPAELRANASAAAAAVLFGASVVAVRVAVHDVPPVGLVVLRFGQAGLRCTEASRGAVMLATMPIWSALLGRIVGERLARIQVAGSRSRRWASASPCCSERCCCWRWLLSRAWSRRSRMDRQLLGVVLLDERRSGLFLLGFAAVVTGSCWPTGRAGGPDP